MWSVEILFYLNGMQKTTTNTCTCIYVVGCQLYACMGGVFGFTSINTLAFISIDRYTVIARPFYAMRHVTHKRAASQIVFVWLWSITWAVMPLVGWGAFIPEGFQTTCSFDYLTQTWMNISYVWSMFTCGFVLPVVTIFTCYIGIVKAVASQAREMGKTAEKMGAKNTKDEKSRKQEMQTAKVAAGTISLFLMAWVPYAFVAIAGILGFQTIVTPYTCMVPVLFAKCGSVWNPMLYALSHPKFRAALEERIPWLLLCKGRNVDKGGDDDESKTDNTNRGSVHSTSTEQVVVGSAPAEEILEDDDDEDEIEMTPTTPNPVPNNAPPARPPPAPLASSYSTAVVR